MTAVSDRNVGKFSFVKFDAFEMNIGRIQGIRGGALKQAEVGIEWFDGVVGGANSLQVAHPSRHHHRLVLLRRVSQVSDAVRVVGGDLEEGDLEATKR